MYCKISRDLLYCRWQMNTQLLNRRNRYDSTGRPDGLCPFGYSRRTLSGSSCHAAAGNPGFEAEHRQSCRFRFPPAGEHPRSTGGQRGKGRALLRLSGYAPGKRCHRPVCAEQGYCGCPARGCVCWQRRQRSGEFCPDAPAESRR